MRDFSNTDIVMVSFTLCFIGLLSALVMSMVMM